MQQLNEISVFNFVILKKRTVLTSRSVSTIWMFASISFEQAIVNSAIYREIKLQFIFILKNAWTQTSIQTYSSLVLVEITKSYTGISFKSFWTRIYLVFFVTFLHSFLIHEKPIECNKTAYFFEYKNPCFGSIFWFIFISNTFFTCMDWSE